MNFNPYLNFNGDCAEAMQFYAEVFGGEVTFVQTFGESGMAADMPPEMHDMVMHATLQIGDRIIMASDDPTGKYKSPCGFHVQTGFPDFDKAKSIFTALSEGGTITMPFEKTFWTEGFGITRDRFGTPWMVNFDDPDE